MLQDEVNDLRTQLAQYEAVSSLKLGIFPSIEKGLKNLDGISPDQDLHDESVLNATSTMPNRDAASDRYYINLYLHYCCIILKRRDVKPAISGISGWFHINQLSTSIIIA